MDAKRLEVAGDDGNELVIEQALRAGQPVVEICVTPPGRDDYGWWWGLMRLTRPNAIQVRDWLNAFIEGNAKEDK